MEMTEPELGVKLPDLPLRRECPYHPPSTASLDQEEPLTRVRLYDGRPVWAVTGHEANRALLTHPHLSVNRENPGFPIPTRMLAIAGISFQVATGALIRTDPPQHTQQRKNVVPNFTVKQIGILRPQIQESVDTHLERMLTKGSSADLVGAYAKPVVLASIADLLGVPQADRAHFEELLFHRFDPVKCLTEYLSELLNSNEELSDGSVLGRLRAQVRRGSLDMDEPIRYALSLPRHHRHHDGSQCRHPPSASCGARPASR
jgi:pentalenic acid synthase